MKLSFHGSKYEYHPEKLEMSEGGVGGRYRGSPWKTHQDKVKNRHRHFPVELTYRGVRYKLD
jgi:hypothetical protein